MEEETLQIESIVDDRWRMEEKIGRGGFGEIYRCTDDLTNKSVALKLIITTISIPGVPNLIDEAKILRAVQGKKFFARYYSFGKTASFDFLVMELLGPNLKSLRNNFPGKKFPVEVTLYNSRMMLKAIQWLHEAGYLHMDIKPSNFAIGIEEKAGRVYLIDFGLSKQYVMDSGELCPLKNKVSFRGTARYSSVNALLGKDAGRCDDLISLFYTLVEMSVPKLPWRKIECRKELAVLKESFDYASLIKDFPTEFLQFYEEANQLKILQKPNYESLLQILNNCLRKCASTRTNSVHARNGGIAQENDYFSDNSLSSQASSTETTITGDVLKNEEELQRTTSSSD